MQSGSGFRPTAACQLPPRPVTLSRAALEVPAIVAYKQPIARSGIELVRGSACDSALDMLLQRDLVAHNPHNLLVTTRAFLAFAGVRHLADLPPLSGPDGARERHLIQAEVSG